MLPCNLKIDRCVKIYRSLSIPLPKEETLSRHSILGPTGLRGQWLGPTAEIKVSLLVQYSSGAELLLFVFSLKFFIFWLISYID